MPKTTGIENRIPRLYRRSALNQMMFGFVLGVRSTLKTITVKDAIYMFMEDFRLEEEIDFNSDSALTTFGRMQKELINSNKNNDENE